MTRRNTYVCTDRSSTDRHSLLQNGKDNRWKMHTFTNTDTLCHCAAYPSALSNLSFTWVCFYLYSAPCLTASLPPLPPLSVLSEREYPPPLPQVSAVGWHVDPPFGAPSTGVSSVTVSHPPMDLRPRRPPSAMMLEPCPRISAAGPLLTCSANSPPNSHAGKRRGSHHISKNIYWWCITMQQQKNLKTM